MCIRDRLVCEDLNPSITSLYTNSYKIDYETKFKIKKIVTVGCWGIQCTFGGGDHDLVLLEDTKGVLSTKSLSTMDADKLDVCEQYKIF